MRRTSKAKVSKPVVAKAAPPDFSSLIKQAEKSGEQDFRLMILQSLTQTPHRQIEPFIPLFRFVHDRDPLFFSHLAVWYFNNGTVRDLKQLFVAFLSTSSFSEEFREAGVTLLLALPPFELERVLGIIKGHKDDEDKFIPGVSNSVPRCVRSGITQYLRQREKNESQFDNVALIARSSLKTLYSSLRIKPGQYAQRILFDDDPPPTSRLHSLKALAKATDPTEQARLIVDNKIPYRVAISSIKAMTGPVLAALINAMTPQEVINNLASLQERGVMSNADLKELVERKLREAQEDKRVSALKTKEAAKVANLDGETIRALEQVQDKRIKATAQITKRTAILIDKSGSMEASLELGKHITAMIAPICKEQTYVWAFDDMAYPITPQTDPDTRNAGMSDWEKAFRGIKASGYTSCGAPLAAMQKRNQVVDQIILVSDCEDNKTPYFPAALSSYKNVIGTDPNVLIVRCGAYNTGIEQALQKEGVTVDRYTFTGDYYGLPSLLPMLAGGSKLELLQEIMDLSLPKRKKEKQPIGAKA